MYLNIRWHFASYKRCCPFFPEQIVANPHNIGSALDYLCEGCEDNVFALGEQNSCSWVVAPVSLCATENQHAQLCPFERRWPDHISRTEVHLACACRLRMAAQHCQGRAQQSGFAHHCDTGSRVASEAVPYAPGWRCTTRRPVGLSGGRGQSLPGQWLDL